MQRRRQSQRPEGPSWRTTLYDIIFEAETPAGRWFDILLLVAIVASIIIVALETVDEYAAQYGTLFWYAEWLLTILFAIEYVLRLICSRQPLRYAFSFWGIIDLLSVLPMFVAQFVSTQSRSFVMLRSIRLLRVFRVLKLWRMMNDADELSAAVWHSRSKIVVFLATVLVAVTISGTLMYQVETIASGPVDGDGPESQFTSIPQSMYWAIVTMTTVGYGDIVPRTSAGKIISACLILLGYSLIIVPSSFVSAELAANRVTEEEDVVEDCANCAAPHQRHDAMYCYRCGERVDHQ
tara:strand:- start:18299 stop:19180 length:882 start_codon:yes stop_codon:yes gene_type:complete